MTRASWSGSLDEAASDQELSEPSAQLTAEDPNPLLVRALQDAHTGRSSGYELLPLLFAARVWLETEPQADAHGQVAVRSVQQNELSWLPVFTSLARLAECAQLSGRGEDELTYGELPGRELERDILPRMPAYTGIVVDAGQEHVFALPPAGADIEGT